METAPFDVNFLVMPPTQLERLDARLEALKLSKAKFARQLGITPQALNNWYTRGYIPESALLRASEILRCDPAWLAYGTERAREEPPEAYFGPSVAFPHPAPQRIEVPHLSWGQLTRFEEVLEKIRMGELTVETTTICGTTVGPRAFSLPVVGDSMRGPGEFSFAEGMRIVVDPDQEAGHRSFVVAMIPEPVFRQLMVEGGMRVLKPINPQYPIHQLTDTDSIIGKVVSFVGILP